MKHVHIRKLVKLYTNITSRRRQIHKIITDCVRYVISADILETDMPPLSLLLAVHTKVQTVLHVDVTLMLTVTLRCTEIFLGSQGFSFAGYSSPVQEAWSRNFPVRSSVKPPVGVPRS